MIFMDTSYELNNCENYYEKKPYKYSATISSEVKALFVSFIMSLYTCNEITVLCVYLDMFCVFLRDNQDCVCIWVSILMCFVYICVYLYVQ
mgnify:CR=1 FL=1